MGGDWGCVGAGVVLDSDRFAFVHISCRHGDSFEHSTHSVKDKYISFVYPAGMKTGTFDY